MLPIKPLVAALLVFLILGVEIHVAVNCFQFYFKSFESKNVQQLNFITKNSMPEINLGPNVSASQIQLLPDPDHKLPAYVNIGTQYLSLTNRVVYHNPIPFLKVENGKSLAASFNTSFKIKLTSRQDHTAYEGMAFFIAPTLEAPENSDGDFLGLLSSNKSSVSGPNQLLALEFDTDPDKKHDEDEDEDEDQVTDFPSNSHIGVDIGSLNYTDPTTVVDSSNKTSNKYFPSLNLHLNYTFTVWLSFDASSMEIKVWMINDTNNTFSSEDQNRFADPPIGKLDPIITTRSKFPPEQLFSEQMYAGFSATTFYDNKTMDRLGAIIYSWGLSVEDIGNSTLSASTSSEAAHRRLLKVIIILVIGACLIACIAIVAFICYRRRRIEKKLEAGANPELVQDLNSINLPARYSYRQLQDSTDNFNERTSLVGEGGFSRVYRGALTNGCVVAIKRLKEGLRKESEFAMELKIISSIRHRNLLQLQGWSYENGEALLVYKFLKNGSLDRYLYGERKGTLDGNIRLRILAGVAAALEYLHSGLGECVLHRDVKAANVLLKDNLEPVLADFGLARLIKHNEAVTATRSGTPGYVAPEIIITGKATDKADVYSFGILMLEVASGSQAISKAVHVERDVYLLDWVKKLHESNNSSIIDALDPSILMLSSDQRQPVAEVERKWKQVLEFALMCCNPSPDSRPNMRYVSNTINEIIPDAVLWSGCSQEIKPALSSTSAPNSADSLSVSNAGNHSSSGTSSSAANTSSSGF